MNYCQSCRRHLNGAVSCPGCGAVDAASPEVQAPRTANWMTEIAWPKRDPLPATESRRAARASADGSPRAKAHTAETAQTSQAAPRPTTRSEDKPANRGPVRAGNPAAALDLPLPNGHNDRRPRKRRGLGLGVTVTGGIAGIIIVGLLILGNLPTTGDSDAPVGAIATVSRSTPHGPGTTSSTGMPTQVSSDSTAAARSTPSATSASPSSSTASPSTSASTTTPAQSATSPQAEQPTSPSTATSSTQSSPTATQSTTSPSSPSPSPSQSQTHVSCILIICW